MKPGLQFTLGQQLTMTPQLQQAIRLLQLSTLDLQQEIQLFLESNPMLEQDDDDTSPTIDETISEVTPAADNWEGASLDSGVETAWDDVYAENTSPSSPSSGGDADTDYLANKSVTESLQDHLQWQLNLTPMSDTDRIIAMAIIDDINDDGYLMETVEDIHASLEKELPDLEIDEVVAVLHRIQHFDPIGVGARDLQECLQLQLKYLSPDTPFLAQTNDIINQHITLLGTRDYPQLMRRTGLKEDELQLVMHLIQTLNPKPGSYISANEAEYIVPDVFVKKVGGRWRIELNHEAIPKLRVNAHYASLVRRADNGEENTYLRNNLQEARWFIKSLQSRNETLMRVATRIVEHQRGFFDYGAEAMKPLVLHEVASVLELHESTISRVTTQKYMHTPHGIYELKYFFSSHVNTETGGECSSTAIRAIIKKLVLNENIKKPLSDSKIATVLTDQGIQVARRTIAKYRESLGIPASNERKRLI